MKHGTIRTWLETVKGIARISGLTLEQVADVFDASEALRLGQPTSSTDEAKPLAEGPKGVQ